MKTILMKFQAPLQSYGTDSHFETRHTDTHPSKSAILGLVAAALGIRREEPERLQELQNLKLVIRVDQEGQMSREFQTAMKYKPNGDMERNDDEEHNYVTYRYYLEDAIFLVALEGEDALMERIFEALKQPCFQLFLGRRACPINYDFLIGLYDDSAIEQLEQFPWLAAEWYQWKHRDMEKVRLDLYGDVSCMQEERQRELRRDQPISFSQMGRQHDFRYESHKSIWVDNPKYVAHDFETEHDAFAALMEG